MKAVVSRLVWWQLALLMIGTSGATTAVNTKITERVVVRERDHIETFIASMGLQFDERRSEHEALRQRIDAIPAAPDYSAELDELAGAIAGIEVPACPTCPDDSEAIRVLESRLLSSEKLLASLRETLVAMPDSHVIHLRVRREGERQFFLRVVDDGVTWSREK